MKITCFKYLSPALFLMLINLPFFVNAHEKPILFNQINEKRFININGIEQWVTIKGDSSKPVILFVHGGPGSPLSPYADAIYSGWEKDFVLVQWDQRGAGKTFGRTAPAELSPDYLASHILTAEQIVNDGISLVEYLEKYLHKQKVTLFGSSWGSVIAAQMAVKQPDLFTAYVGHSQVVNPAENFLKAYQKVSGLAKATNDQQSLDMLAAIGAPPYERAQAAGKLFRIIKKYERLASTPAPEAWWKMAPEYDNKEDNQHREDGDDYSFLSFVGDAKMGVRSMAAGINLANNNYVFKIPVYLIQGEEDILTSKEVSQAYFDKIVAPRKQFIIIKKAAHGFDESVVKEQLRLFKLVNR
nr:alpha/beta hydrolase [uncultured Mucilaginibacter sp.]